MKLAMYLKNAIWLPFKLFWLPMAVYLGIYMNGKSYSDIHRHISSTFIDNFHEYGILNATEFSFFLFETLLAIPSFIASVMPAGFFYVGYISVFTGEDILFFAIWMLFLVTARPQIPQFVLRKLSKD